MLAEPTKRARRSGGRTASALCGALSNTTCFADAQFIIRNSQSAIRNPNSPSSLRLELLQLFECSRPVLAEKPRKPAIRQQFAASLTCRAVVGFVVRVGDALNWRSATRAGLAEAP